MSAAIHPPVTSAPPVLVFYCDGGSLADPGEAPTLPGASFVRVPCVGRVAEGDLLRALRLGAPAVWLVGCARDACRFHRGEARAAEAVGRVRRVLSRLGLPDGPVAWLATGPGATAQQVVQARLGSVQAEAGRPFAEARWTLRTMPPRAPWPHHGAVQEAALLSCLVPTRPAAPPPWAAAKEGLGRGGTDLLYACDLPAVEELLGEPFGVGGAGVRRAALLLARAAGLRPVVAESLPSCGHDFRLQGDHRSLGSLSALTREALRGPGVERVVPLCPECAETLRDRYPRAGAELGLEITELGDLLYERRASLGFESLTPGPRVALQVDVDPRTEERQERGAALLEAAGYQVVARLPDPFAEPGTQGSAGVAGFVACDGAARVAQDLLLGTAEEAGAELLVCASPLSTVHLGCAQRRGGWRRHRLAVTSLYEALAARLAPAPGGVAPEGE